MQFVADGLVERKTACISEPTLDCIALGNNNNNYDCEAKAWVSAHDSFIFYWLEDSFIL